MYLLLSENKVRELGQNADGSFFPVLQQNLKKGKQYR